jgi:hypothetical protein
MRNSPVPPHDQVFLRALVASARTDAPPVGAKARASGNIDARARRAHEALSGSLRVVAGVAVLGISLSWSLSMPSSVPARPPVDCAISDERPQALSTCATGVDGATTASVSHGDGASSGSGSG